MSTGKRNQCIVRWGETKKKECKKSKEKQRKKTVNHCKEMGYGDREKK